MIARQGKVSPTPESSAREGVLPVIKSLNEGLHAFSNHPGVRAVLFRLRYPLVILALLLFLPHIEPPWYVPALLTGLAGEALQLWCFGILDKNTTLTRRGPYALCRNPMYIGRFFLLFGCLMLFGNPFVLGLFVIVYYFYAVNRVKREERRLQALFGSVYEQYGREVHRFWPVPRTLDPGALLAFDRRLFLKNHGHLNLLAILACYGLFYLAAFPLHALFEA